MSRRTPLVVGGAIAAALALGGLVGGVLAESHGSAQATAAPAALADRALTGAAASLGASATQDARGPCSGGAPRCGRAHRARVRLPAALAGDRRRLVPPSVRGGAPTCAAVRDRRCEPGARSRLARAHPPRVPRRAAVRPPRGTTAAGLVSPVRRHGRRARRARTLRRGVRRLRPDDLAPPEPRLVRSSRLCPGARR